MEKRILFASNNRGKYDELAKDFAIKDLDLVFYEDIGLQRLVLPEDYEILAENAKEKAKAAAMATGLYTLGDDSGVFISCLDGFPGVHSRRWAGAASDDLFRNEKIIELMKDEKDRSAYLISRFSLVDPSGEEIYKTVVKNEFTISDTIKGSSGFGYDAILIPKPENVNASSLSKDRKDEIINNSCTIAQLSQQEKNAINNRGKIAEEISDFFKKEGKMKNEIQQRMDVSDVAGPNSKQGKGQRT